MSQHLPNHLIDNRRAPFPKGVFLGTIKGVAPQWSKDTKSMALVPTFAGIVPVDGPEVGNRTYSPRLQVLLGGTYVTDIVDFSDPSVSYPLAKAAGLIGSLAIALGAALRTASGLDFEMEPFLEDLQNGLYNGQTVIVEVGNRDYKNRAGDDVTDDSPLRFAPANGTAPAVEAPVAVEDVVPESGSAAATELQAVAAQAATTQAPRSLRTRQ